MGVVWYTNSLFFSLLLPVDFGGGRINCGVVFWFVYITLLTEFLLSR